MYKDNKTSRNRSLSKSKHNKKTISSINDTIIESIIKIRQFLNILFFNINIIKNNRTTTFYYLKVK